MRAMRICPHLNIAYKCTYYAHYIYSSALCQDKQREKLNEEEDKAYCGKCLGDCKGYEIDKRYKRS